MDYEELKEDKVYKLITEISRLKDLLFKDGINFEFGDAEYIKYKRLCEELSATDTIEIKIS
ncbi:hypothetical protein J4476_04315 [Candidatus Woesearchaeota archaeon]|nr:MAG: hypothetical protein QT09_C0014G0010 [archaeon GW2011_AR18]MBS3161888.1 hypothetical protein [Candidatus Woesearchaeota archaeon]HIH25187.1 hypothetical protein [Nanoarchaeota archaeon]